MIFKIIGPRWGDKKIVKFEEFPIATLTVLKVIFFIMLYYIKKLKKKSSMCIMP